MNFFSPELYHELFTISDNHYTNSNSNCGTWISNTTFQNHSASADGNIPDASASSCWPLMTSLHLLIKPCMSIYIWKYILFHYKWLFCWSAIALPCCVTFCWTKWISYMYMFMYMPSLLSLIVDFFFSLQYNYGIIGAFQIIAYIFIITYSYDFLSMNQERMINTYNKKWYAALQNSMEIP